MRKTIIGKTIIALNLVILVGLTTAEPCMAQIGRGGLIRRLFGRNIQEEEDTEKEAKEKAEKEAKAKAEAAKKQKNKSASSAKSDKRGSPTPAPSQPTLAQQSPTQGTARNGSSPAAERDAFGLSTKAFPLDRKGNDSALGLAVVAVEKGSAADEAGITKGDQLVKIAGSAIDDAFSLSGLEAVLAKGDLIEIELIRKKKPKSVNLTVQHDGEHNEKSQTNPSLSLAINDNGEAPTQSGLQLEEFSSPPSPSSERFADRQPLPLVPPANSESSSRRSILETVDPIELPSLNPQTDLTQSDLRQTVEEQAAIIREQNAEIERLRNLLRK